FIDEGIDAELVVARHRTDLVADTVAGPNEQRQDQIAGRQLRLAHQLADKRMMPQPPWAGTLGCGDLRHLHGTRRIDAHGFSPGEITLGIATKNTKSHKKKAKRGRITFSPPGVPFSPCCSV